MKYKLAIFDLDGTVLDTLDDLYTSVCYALEQCGYPARTKDEVRRFVGNGIRRLIDLAVPEGTSEKDADRVYKCFNEYYPKHCADATKPYDGIADMLQMLKTEGCRLAVVSNKADYAVKPLCETYFSGIFDFAVGEREGIKRKPAPDAVYEVLQTLGFRREESVYIGDSDVDIKTAENSGVDCISVDWGFRDREFLRRSGASVIVSDTAKLGDIILGKRTDHSKIAGDLFLEGYNCSQSAFLAFRDITGMDKQTALRLSSSFGGGMGRMREVCGAVSGIFMVAGMLWGYDRPGDIESKAAHYARIQSLAEAFRSKHGSIVCRDILKGIVNDSSPNPTVRDAEFYKKRPCLHCIEDAAAVLDDMIAELGIPERTPGDVNTDKTQTDC